MDYKKINNILHFRESENDEFKPCSLEQMTDLLFKIQGEINGVIEDRNKLAVKYNNLAREKNNFNSGILEAMELGGVKTYRL